MPKRKHGEAKQQVMEGQSEEERRALRQSQRQLLDRMQEKSEEMVQLDSEAFEEEREQNNLLFDQVKFTRELANDGDNLVVIGELATKRSAQLAHSVTQYSSAKIIEKLKVDYNRRKCSKGPWVALGNDVAHLYSAVPKMGFMVGILQSPEVQKEPKKKKQKQTQEDSSKLEATQYDTTDYSDKQSQSQEKKQEEATNKRLQNLLGHMTAQNGHDMDLVNLLVNPDKFSETVENFFDLSFLVKDGRAKIALDNDGIAYTALTEPPDEQVPKSQTVVVLSAADNKKLAELWNLQQATLCRDD